MTIKIGDIASFPGGTTSYATMQDSFIAEKDFASKDFASCYFKITAENMSTITADKRLYLVGFGGNTFVNSDGTGSYVIKSYDGLTTYKTQAFNSVSWGNDSNDRIVGVIEVTEEMKTNGFYLHPTDMSVLKIVIYNETEPQVFITTPTVNGETSSTATLSVKCDENSTAYYLISKTSDNLDPNADHVKAVATGSVVLTKDVEATVTISELQAETAYDVFIAAEDTLGNIQATVTKVQFSTLAIPVVETPTASLQSGTYTESQTVLFECATAGAEIRYTEDGSEPTAGSTLYSMPIIIEESKTVKAKAFKTGYTESGILTLNYVIEIPKVETPTASLASGTYTGNKVVELSCATVGAEIRFTTDGTEPTASSNLYSEMLLINSTKNIKAKAFKTGYTESDTLTLNYIIIGGSGMGKLGLPSVLIQFESALNTAISQGETGVLALILKDSSVTVLTEYKLKINTDIPKTLSAENQKALSLAFEGSPKTVKAIVLPATALDYTAGLEYLEAIQFNVMTIPYIATGDVNTVKLWSIGMYDNKNTKIIAVLPNCAADHPAVVNWTQDNIVSKDYDDTDLDAAESISGIAGLIAGLPLTIAPTYQQPTWIDDAPKMTKDAADERVGNGELFIYSKQGKNRVARGVTSLVNASIAKPEAFRKIKLVRIYNKVYTDITTTIDDFYIGKVQNSYDDQVQLIGVINGYFEKLEQIPILEKGINTCEVNISKKRAYLEGISIDTSNMTEQEIKEYNTGDKVFLKGKITALDAMEEIEFDIGI